MLPDDSDYAASVLNILRLALWDRPGVRSFTFGTAYTSRYRSTAEIQYDPLAPGRGRVTLLEVRPWGQYSVTVGAAIGADNPELIQRAVRTVRRVINSKKPGG